MVGMLHRFALRVFRALPRSLRRGIVRRIAPSFTVGAVCVIERTDGRILLVRQSYRERWGIPGGLLQRNESPAVAAVRESAEEIGLAVVVLGEPVVVVDAAPRRVDVVFRARPGDGVDPDSARPSSPEITEVAWFATDRLPELQHEASQILQALARASFSPPARPVVST